MSLVYQDAHGALWHGDSRVVLPTLPAESAQLICTSPPYNVGWDYGDGGTGDSLPLPEYLDGLLAPVLAECHRVLRHGGVLALNLPVNIRVYDTTPEGAPVGLRTSRHGTRVTRKRGSTPVLHRAFPLRSWAEMHLLTVGWLLREPIAWVKAFADDSAYTASTAIGGPANPYLRPCREEILLASKGTYAMASKDSKRWPGAASEFGRYLEWAKDVWHIRPGRAAQGEPLAFPDELVSRLVHLYSAPGDVVLDPFSGNGVTARVAKTLGRVGWAIELRDRYVPRLQAVVGQGRLDLEPTA